MMGTQQSGVLNLKIADVVKDTPILYVVRNLALEILQDDPTLSKVKNNVIKNTFSEISKTTGAWSNIS
jgi:ATP-dependent DNA helicase RecG